MTEYEMMSLLLEQGTYASAGSMNFVSIVSAYLIAAFFLAHQLTRPMVVVFNGLYLMFAVGLAYAMEGHGLQWHVAASPPVQV